MISDCASGKGTVKFDVCSRSGALLGSMFVSAGMVSRKRRSV